MQLKKRSPRISIQQIDDRNTHHIILKNYIMILTTGFCRVHLFKQCFRYINGLGSRHSLFCSFISLYATKIRIPSSIISYYFIFIWKLVNINLSLTYSVWCNLGTLKFTTIIEPNLLFRLKHYFWLFQNMSNCMVLWQ